jgi:hydroxymethylpyrimidine/phosphomethylpyrimidine kinase
VDALSGAAVVAQIEAVLDDIGANAVKTGMLLNQEIIQAVVDTLLAVPVSPPLVVDPVMVSRTGAQLIDDGAIKTLTNRLLPLATLVTPNRYEAQLLTGLTLTTLADMEAAAQAIYQLGPRAVLVKGGGMADPLRGVNLWFDGKEVVVLATETVDTPHTHGTGCTLSAAIAAHLALGASPRMAVEAAKDYVTQALKHALALGRGQGPVGHFFPLLRSPD